MLLIGFVREDRPNWSDKRCAQWLARSMPDLRGSIRRHVRDWIREDLLAEALASERV